MEMRIADDAGHAGAAPCRRRMPIRIGASPDVATAGNDACRMTTPRTIRSCIRTMGALATHYHPDHVGGEVFGFEIEGLPRLMARSPVKVHCHRLEGDGIRKVTDIDESDLVRHDSGDKVKVGDVEIELLHTPGHTPGSICFRLPNALVAGDTLFLQGCGRVDLPGGDPDEMYTTLTQRLSTLPGDTVLFPGHAYGGESADMDTVRRTNKYLRIPDRETWLRVMG
jgi:glyoxylase-like metal-dependent hydrolase (beta-lactamase superfamily II)